MVMYNKNDIIRFISIKCGCTLAQAKEMLEAFYEFVEFTLKNGDAVSCQPLGVFYFQNVKQRHYNTLVYSHSEKKKIHVEGTSPAYTKLKFKINKNIYNYIRKMTENNQLKIINRGNGISDVGMEDEEGFNES